MSRRLAIHFEEGIEYEALKRTLVALVHSHRRSTRSGHLLAAAFRQRARSLVGSSNWCHACR